ncbi:hypothetical protein Lpp27_15403 [Lacticaseibacillus paracasei subsp. paracasei CNCM I-4648]|nr:hypothetical protein Lpp27_15403 [Lacticaseibacillus paracasei subsp. paracasei CNCM I-4648]
MDEAELPALDADELAALEDDELVALDAPDDEAPLEGVDGLGPGFNASTCLVNAAINEAKALSCCALKA